jgi:hypothetical protein
VSRMVADATRASPRGIIALMLKRIIISIALDGRKSEVRNSWTLFITVGRARDHDMLRVAASPVERMLECRARRFPKSAIDWRYQP